MPLMCATVPSSHGTHGEVPSSFVFAPFVSVKVPGGQATQAVAFFASWWIQGTFKEHLRNIQGTFKERSRNIQGTFKEHSRNIRGRHRHGDMSVPAHVEPYLEVALGAFLAPPLAPQAEEGARVAHAVRLGGAAFV
eukprot:3356678-Pyramimonas_sp.AAC.1